MSFFLIFLELFRCNVADIPICNTVCNKEPSLCNYRLFTVHKVSYIMFPLFLTGSKQPSAHAYTEPMFCHNYQKLQLSLIELGEHFQQFLSSWFLYPFVVRCKYMQYPCGIHFSYFQNVPQNEIHLHQRYANGLAISHIVHLKLFPYI